MAYTPFKLRSGNKTSFKEMGSSHSPGETPEHGKSPLNQIAYGGTKTWGQGQEDSGGTLNDITIQQRAYEKEMKAKDPSWNKREDNTWKTTQNKINKHLGSSKVYDTIPENKTKEIDETETMKGLGSGKGKTLTEQQKQNEQTNINIEKDKIKLAKDKSETGFVDKDKRDLAQQEIGEIKGGRDDAYTGTVVSRIGGRLKAGWNRRQLKKRGDKRERIEEKIQKRKDKGKSTDRLEKRYQKKGGDLSDLE